MEPVEKRQNKVMVVVPVYNEEKTLRAFIGSLINFMKKNIIQKVVAVNGHSTDSSSEILDSFSNVPGFIHLVLSEEYGKAYAFYKGAKVCYSEGASIIVMLDADILEITEQQIKDLYGPISENEEIDMVIGSVFGDATVLSGQRAFRREALTYLLDEEKKDNLWLENIAGIIQEKDKEVFVTRIGYGLEEILDFFISRKVDTGDFLGALEYGFPVLLDNILYQPTEIKCGPNSWERSNTPRKRAENLFRELTDIEDKIKILESANVKPKLPPTKGGRKLAEKLAKLKI